MSNSYAGLTFSSGLTLALSVFDCYFFNFNDRVLQFETSNKYNCHLKGCICVCVGAASGDVGGIINFKSSTSNIICANTLFFTTVGTAYGFFFDITSNSLDLSFLSLEQRVSVQSTHMAIRARTNKGVMPNVNISHVDASDNAGIQPENAIDISFLIVSECKGRELIRISNSQTANFHHFIFANSVARSGLFSLYENPFTLSDATFFKITGPFVHTELIDQGHTARVLLKRPVFHGFSSIPSHQYLTIESGVITAKQPTIITRRLILKNVFESCPCGRRILYSLSSLINFLS